MAENSDTVLKSINSQAVVLYLVAQVCLFASWYDTSQAWPELVASFNFINCFGFTFLRTFQYIGCCQITAEVVASFAACYFLLHRVRTVSKLRIILEMGVLIVNAVFIHIFAMYALFQYAVFEGWQGGSTNLY